jgi:hypothetical protein
LERIADDARKRAAVVAAGNFGPSGRGREGGFPLPMRPIVSGENETHGVLERRGPMAELLVILGLITVAVGFPVLMIWGLIQLWRDKGRGGTLSSGVAGALSELDRVVRPSVEHVHEAKKSVKKQDDDIGGE